MLLFFLILYLLLEAGEIGGCLILLLKQANVKVMPIEEKLGEKENTYR